MSVKRSVTIGALALGTALLMGGTAHADQRPSPGDKAAATAPSPKAISLQIGTGSTQPGVGWLPYGPNSIYLDVDTSAAGFTSIPNYVASINGIGNQSQLKGVGAIYSPTPTGFRVYARWTNDAPLSPADAQLNGWYISWVGAIA